ncbi:MAG: ABC transporter permease [Chitinophagaceae bacterium]
MIKNYLLLAFKNFRKQKMFSLINILGLTVGITCCLMIFLFILNEVSYDKFHKNGKDIYRVMRVGNLNGVKREIPYLSAPYSTALQNDYPDAIQSTVRVSPDNDLISYKNIGFNEKNIFLTDSNFFQFFSFPLLKGNPATVLKEPTSIVLTESAAKKYFSNEDPIGKVLEMNKKIQLKVTGIAKDVPANSHITFDMIVPISNWRNDQWFKQWPNNGMYVYVQLKPSVDAATLRKQFPSFMDKYMGKYYAESGFHMGLTINPLRSIYFEGESPVDAGVKHGSKKMVYIFMSIAILILVIACINFMNLATARATERSKEVGLRKVMGALRKQLIGQFILESLLFSSMAAILALLLLKLTMPAYTGLLGYELPQLWGNPMMYAFLLGVVIVVGLLAGSYPALLLSSFSPIESLKGKLRLGKNGAIFRKVLVVFQFGISVLLIICITIIMSQMHYIKNTDLGFNKEQTLILPLDNGEIWNKKFQLKNQLQQHPAVESVSLMSGEPGGFHDAYGFETDAKPGEKMMFSTEFSDFEYVKTLGLKITAGRDFSVQFPTDSTQSVLINHAAASQMGYTPEKAIGHWVKNTSDSVRHTIIGVVEDFHFASLKQTIAPLIISTGNDKRLALVKLKTMNLPSTLADFKKIYTNAESSYPFEYTFLDEKFNRLYKAEIRQESVLTVFSIIAIAIACLGLFGLASYTAVKRTKEIGVRKVLGSSAQNIVLLLSKDLLKPVLVGTLIAVPVGYYAMSRWLDNFAYRISIEWWMFVAAALAAIAIALATVSLQAIKAAMGNPVKALRSE